MRYDHRKPLLAFVVVALACGLIVANGLRSQAVVGFLHRGGQHDVTGTPAAPAAPHVGPAAPVAAPSAPSRARVAVPAPARVPGRAGPRTQHPRGSTHVGRGHSAHPDPSPGRVKAPGHGAAPGPRGHATSHGTGHRAHGQHLHGHH